MPYLRNMMREIFEKQRILSIHSNNPHFEEGLLEKIINLAFASLWPYSSKLWEIAAVGSPMHLHKLYQATGNKNVTECAYALIIFDTNRSVPERPAYGSTGDPPAIKRYWNINREIDMLSLAIGCAAKYYCVDHFIIKAFDSQAVMREFSPDSRSKAAEIICIGFFKDMELPHSVPLGQDPFSGSVRII